MTFAKYLIYNNSIHNSSEFEFKDAYREPPMTIKYYNNVRTYKK